MHAPLPHHSDVAASVRGKFICRRPPKIESRTASMQHMRGFLPLHWDARKGRLYLEIPHLNVDFLYFNSLPYGVGSNDLGWIAARFPSRASCASSGSVRRSC
jgi:hypothetical protein